MSSISPSLQRLLYLAKKIPYLHSKHTYHITESILAMSDNDLESFFREVIELKKKILVCPSCFAWMEASNDCYWCASDRDTSILCIVETWIDAVSIDRAKTFSGMYHILGGSVSPFDRVDYNQLNFDALLQRIQQLPVKEILIATNQTPQGEMTASYIEEVVKKSEKEVTVSYLASGIPVGTSLEYVDKITIQKAISYRRKLY